MAIVDTRKIKVGTPGYMLRQIVYLMESSGKKTEEYVNSKHSMDKWRGPYRNATVVDRFYLFGEMRSNYCAPEMVEVIITKHTDECEYGNTRVLYSVKSEVF